MGFKQFVMSPSGVLPVELLCGWLGKPVAKGGRPDLVQEAFELWTSQIPRFRIFGSQPTAGGRSMLWEVGRKILGTDSPNYPQEIGDCFVDGTMISMADGSRKRIEDVKEEDVVITPLGNCRRVIRTVAKQYTGELFCITAKGAAESVETTPDHRFVHVPRWDCNSLTWTAIAEFVVGDKVLMPYGVDIDSNPENITLDNVSSQAKPIPDSIAIDERFSRLFGLYLAEGSIKKHSKTNTPCGIRFSLGGHESILAEEVVELIRSIFKLETSVTPRRDKNVLIVDCNNVNIGRLFSQLCKENVYSKYVPDIFFRSNRLSRLALLRGWYDGDTCVSASSRLLADMWRIALSCGLRPRLNKRKRAPHQRVASGQINLYGNSAAVIGLKTTSKIHRRLRDTNQFGWANSIKTISTRFVEDITVRCLEVETDHAFIANGYAVHNCVSFGAKNAIEYIQYFPLINGQRIKWTQVFPPYLYGCGRVLIGGGQLGRQDGSIGAWQAQSVMKYGTVSLHDSSIDVPPYSGEIARQWGYSGPPKNFVQVGQKYLVKSAAAVKSWGDVVTALVNGYAVTCASNVGFDMTPRSDGFNHYSTHWGHQLCIIGVDDDASNPYACILNSWGDVHGRIKDFKTGEQWPVGTLRVRRQDVEAILAENDSFAYSSFDGFPAQSLPEELFELW